MREKARICAGPFFAPVRTPRAARCDIRTCAIARYAIVQCIINGRPDALSRPLGA